MYKELEITRLKKRTSCYYYLYKKNYKKVKRKNKSFQPKQIHAYELPMSCSYNFELVYVDGKEKRGKKKKEKLTLIYSGPFS